MAHASPSIVRAFNRSTIDLCQDRFDRLSRPNSPPLPSYVEWSNRKSRTRFTPRKKVSSNQEVCSLRRRTGTGLEEVSPNCFRERKKNPLIVRIGKSHFRKKKYIFLTSLLLLPVPREKVASKYSRSFNINFEVMMIIK